jgi:hypothetical protein
VTCPAVDLSFRRTNRFPAGLAAVNDDPFWSTVPFQRTSKKPLCRSEITPFTEPELDRVAVAINGSIEIHPPSTGFDVGFIDMPPAGDRALSPIELLKQEWSIVDGPTADRGVIDQDAALRHHLFEISQAQVIGQVPPDAQQDH